MGAYTVIADVSKSIVEMLRKGLVPEPMTKEESIGLCQPNDRGNYILGLYLYNIEENPETRSQPRVVIDREHYKEPPTSLNLYYMLFVHSESEVIARSIDEHRIIGKAIQVINDNRRISKEYLMGTVDENDEIVDIQNLVINLDEKIKIWSLFDMPYRTSCFYKVGPIFLESEKIKTVKRVTSADIQINQK